MNYRHYSRYVSFGKMQNRERIIRIAYLERDHSAGSRDGVMALNSAIKVLENLSDKEFLEILNRVKEI